jgi:hypothetical protein
MLSNGLSHQVGFPIAGPCGKSPIVKAGVLIQVKSNQINVDILVLAAVIASSSVTGE